MCIRWISARLTHTHPHTFVLNTVICGCSQLLTPTKTCLSIIDYNELVDWA